MHAQIEVGSQNWAELLNYTEHEWVGERASLVYKHPNKPIRPINNIFPAFLHMK